MAVKATLGHLLKTLLTVGLLASATTLPIKTLMTAAWSIPDAKLK